MKVFILKNKFQHPLQPDIENKPCWRLSGCYTEPPPGCLEKSFMKRRIIILFIIIFTIIGITSCKNGEKELFEKIIETEKKLLQNNISKILDELEFQDKYSISIIYQKTQEYSKRAVSEQVITKRIFGKADFSKNNSNPDTVDGMWEEKAYTANYNDKKENDDLNHGYFSVIIILDEPDKEKQDKIMALMNYSVANSIRGDLINVISKSNF